MVGAKAHQIVAKVVEGTLILGVVGAGQAVSHHHIGLPVCNGSYHLGGSLSGVGVVAIHQHVGFGIDLAEHAAHDIAFTLLILVPDDSTSLGGQLGGAVGGIVIVDIDGSVGQHAAEIRHHLFHSFGFVVARDQNSDLIHFEILQSLHPELHQTGNIKVQRGVQSLQPRLGGKKGE